MTYMHRIWLGSPMPERYREYGEEWKSLNPDDILVDWTQEKLLDRSWHNQEVIDHMIRESKRPGADLVAYYTHLADVMDYELVYDLGGWYFNTDLKPLKPLPSITYAALAMEDDVHPVNMAMHGPKGHAFFGKIIELLPKRYFGMPGSFMNRTTGVQLLEQALTLYNGPVALFDRTVFNPIHWSQIEPGATPDLDREFFPETIAVHEWLHRTNQRGQKIL